VDAAVAAVSDAKSSSVASQMKDDDGKPNNPAKTANLLQGKEAVRQANMNLEHAQKKLSHAKQIQSIPTDWKAAEAKVMEEGSATFGAKVNAKANTGPSEHVKASTQRKIVEAVTGGVAGVNANRVI